MPTIQDQVKTYVNSLDSNKIKTTINALKDILLPAQNAGDSAAGAVTSNDVNSLSVLLNNPGFTNLKARLEGIRQFIDGSSEVDNTILIHMILLLVDLKALVSGSDLSPEFSQALKQCIDSAEKVVRLSGFIDEVKEQEEEGLKEGNASFLAFLDTLKPRQKMTAASPNGTIHKGYDTLGDDEYNERRPSVPEDASPAELQGTSKPHQGFLPSFIAFEYVELLKAKLANYTFTSGSVAGVSRTYAQDQLDRFATGSVRSLTEIYTEAMQENLNGLFPKSMNALFTKSMFSSGKTWETVSFEVAKELIKKHPYSLVYEYVLLRSLLETIFTFSAKDKREIEKRLDKRARMMKEIRFWMRDLAQAPLNSQDELMRFADKYADYAPLIRFFLLACIHNLSHEDFLRMVKSKSKTLWWLLGDNQGSLPGDKKAFLEKAIDIFLVAYPKVDPYDLIKALLEIDALQLANVQSLTYRDQEAKTHTILLALANFQQEFLPKKEPKFDIKSHVWEKFTSSASAATEVVVDNTSIRNSRKVFQPELRLPQDIPEANARLLASHTGVPLETLKTLIVLNGDDQAYLDLWLKSLKKEAVFTYNETSYVRPDASPHAVINYWILSFLKDFHECRLVSMLDVDQQPPTTVKEDEIILQEVNEKKMVEKVEKEVKKVRAYWSERGKVESFAIPQNEASDLIEPLKNQKSDLKSSRDLSFIKKVTSRYHIKSLDEACKSFSDNFSQASENFSFDAKYKLYDALLDFANVLLAHLAVQEKLVGNPPARLSLIYQMIYVLFFNQVFDQYVENAMNAWLKSHPDVAKDYDYVAPLDDLESRGIPEMKRLVALRHRAKVLSEMVLSWEKRQAQESSLGNLLAEVEQNKFQTRDSLILQAIKTLSEEEDWLQIFKLETSEKQRTTLIQARYAYVLTLPGDNELLRSTSTGMGHHDIINHGATQPDQKVDVPSTSMQTVWKNLSSSFNEDNVIKLAKQYLTEKACKEATLIISFGLLYPSFGKKINFALLMLEAIKQAKAVVTGIPFYLFPQEARALKEAFLVLSQGHHLFLASEVKSIGSIQDKVEAVPANAIPKDENAIVVAYYALRQQCDIQTALATREVLVGTNPLCAYGEDYPYAKLLGLRLDPQSYYIYWEDKRKKASKYLSSTAMPLSNDRPSVPVSSLPERAADRREENTLKEFDEFLTGLVQGAFPDHYSIKNGSEAIDWYFIEKSGEDGILVPESKDPFTFIQLKSLLLDRIFNKTSHFKMPMSSELLTEAIDELYGDLEPRWKSSKGKTQVRINDYKKLKRETNFFGKTLANAAPGTSDRLNKLFKEVMQFDDAILAPSILTSRLLPERKNKANPTPMGETEREALIGSSANVVTPGVHLPAVNCADREDFDAAVCQAIQDIDKYFLNNTLEVTGLPESFKMVVSEDEFGNTSLLTQENLQGFKDRWAEAKKNSGFQIYHLVSLLKQKEFARCLFETLQKIADISLEVFLNSPEVSGDKSLETLREEFMFFVASEISRAKNTENTQDKLIKKIKEGGDKEFMDILKSDDSARLLVFGLTSFVEMNEKDRLGRGLSLLKVLAMLALHMYRDVLSEAEKNKIAIAAQQGKLKDYLGTDTAVQLHSYYYLAYCYLQRLQKIEDKNLASELTPEAIDKHCVDFYYNVAYLAQISLWPDVDNKANNFLSPESSNNSREIALKNVPGALSWIHLIEERRLFNPKLRAWLDSCMRGSSVNARDFPKDPAYQKWLESSANGNDANVVINQVLKHPYKWGVVYKKVNVQVNFDQEKYLANLRECFNYEARVIRGIISLKKKVKSIGEQLETGASIEPNNMQFIAQMAEWYCRATQEGVEYSANPFIPALIVSAQLKDDEAKSIFHDLVAILCGAFDTMMKALGTLSGKSHTDKNHERAKRDEAWVKTTAFEAASYEFMKRCIMGSSVVAEIYLDTIQYKHNEKTTFTLLSREQADFVFELLSKKHNRELKHRQACLHAAFAWYYGYFDRSRYSQKMGNDNVNKRLVAFLHDKVCDYDLSQDYYAYLDQLFMQENVDSVPEFCHPHSGDFEHLKDHALYVLNCLQGKVHSLKQLINFPMCQDNAVKLNLACYIIDSLSKYYEHLKGQGKRVDKSYTNYENVFNVMFDAKSFQDFDLRLQQALSKLKSSLGVGKEDDSTPYLEFVNPRIGPDGNPPRGSIDATNPLFSREVADPSFNGAKVPEEANDPRSQSSSRSVSFSENAGQLFSRKPSVDELRHKRAVSANPLSGKSGGNG